MANKTILEAAQKVAAGNLRLARGKQIPRRSALRNDTVYFVYEQGRSVSSRKNLSRLRAGQAPPLRHVRNQFSRLFWGSHTRGFGVEEVQWATVLHECVRLRFFLTSGVPDDELVRLGDDLSLICSVMERAGSIAEQNPMALIFFPLSGPLAQAGRDSSREKRAMGQRSSWPAARQNDRRGWREHAPGCAVVACS